MSYKNVLSEMVEKSGLTLREIAEKCKEYHVKIDPSYISKLQTGKQSPASEDINIALAKVCAGDPEYLLFEAYMEKAPKVIKDILGNVTSTFRKFAKTQLTKAPKNTATFKEQIISDMPDWQLLQHVLKYGVGMGIIPFEETRRTVKIAGDPDIESEMIENELFRYTLDDNSMIPIIPKGSKVQLDNSQDIQDGDIVIAQVNHRTIVRRYFSVDDKIILAPENKANEVLKLNKNDAIILGKVKEIITEV